MRIVITSEPGLPKEPTIEIVERKGLGHPDTICDALAEEISRALSRYYFEHFGKVLHHNVDKVLLRGGSSNPVFGGGAITAPIEICLGGRATSEVKGESIPVKELALLAARAWFKGNLKSLNIDRDVKLNCLIRPGSADLVELFQRSEEPLANDTSVGVGFAPFSPLEKTVLEIDRFLHDESIGSKYPEIGKDTKVMGFQGGNGAELTVACAFVSRYVASLDDYFEKKKRLQGEIARVSKDTLGRNAEIFLNAADHRQAGSIYLTVSGTSAESGDDGEVGRGNRVNGLITPFRPMSLEAAAGKNSVSHTGKIYQIAAGRIAGAIAKEIQGVYRTECFLLSQIGQPISNPKLAVISGQAETPFENYRDPIEEILHAELSRLKYLSREIFMEKVQIF